MIGKCSFSLWIFFEESKDISKDIADKKLETNLKSEEVKTKEVKKKRYPIFQSLKRLYIEFGIQDKKNIIIAILSSILVGALLPVGAYVFGKYLSIYENPDDNFYFQSKILLVYFIIMALVAMISIPFQKASFGIIGENIAFRLRKSLYQKFLRMPMQWHEDPENSFGILSTRLERDAESLSNLISSIMGYVWQSASSTLFGFIIAFVHSWKITLVALGMTPFMHLSSVFISYCSEKTEIELDKLTESSTTLVETVPIIKTISSLGAENAILSKYQNKIEDAAKSGKKAAFWEGFSTGLSFTLTYYFLGVLEIFSGYVKDSDNISTEDLIVTFYVAYLTINDVGTLLSLIPDLTTSLTAAKNLFGYLDEPENVIRDGSLRLDKNNKIEGNIEFKNVSFSYPSRKKNIFSNLSFKIQPGENVGFVGLSGSGKSTIIQLLMRFYDVDEGEILIDGKNIKDFKLQDLRTIFGAVFQEPVLFEGTIKENIKYSHRNVSQKEIREAARKANALDFIEKYQFEYEKKDCDEEPEATGLGEGFKRLVGTKGGQLSCGQKQRIAIARVLVRKPDVYLFDEATSALDTKSESIVQEALIQLAKETTTITVAHRVTTYKNCDKIFVLNEGVIVEEGNFEELILKKRHLYNHVNGMT